MGLGGSWDGGRYPCPWKGWNEMEFKVPSNPNQAGILCWRGLEPLGSHGGPASLQGKPFKNFPFRANHNFFFPDPLEQQLHEIPQKRCFCCRFPAGGRERRSQLPVPSRICSGLFRGPCEVMENFPRRQVLLPSVSCSSPTPSKCYKHTGTI